ncbi:MAG: type II toxin-antitoxin system VapC family toxin [Cocleimonas sp.]|nr:type II toxin-antitoxin system VapC family toxin [Cocleimonas sp.]
MIAVDTNILVRYAVKDDPKQTLLATDFLRNNTCFFSKTVLLELVWVLSSKNGYNLSREVVIERIKHIVGLDNITTENDQHFSDALKWYLAGMDFADALHLIGSESLDGFATLDKRMVNKSKEIKADEEIIYLK